ncbi:methyltransferase domain-containing protein [Rhizobium sp. CFBP 8762]|uniref:methyltransferase domain-containing protein n=1 Tax=Rhizobium sp. CFBP 8762 TaxID=2775279 RepID=UPI00177C2247|nr:methyltransferase domain-containing protein [Rhizobium sp. CFBP 8762]MBD8553568.1 methyltransferase domain-containing protein [Rhizobium sp. CFBP 8762]
MIPHQLSSGDYIADRRADYARLLFEAGDWNGAADLLRQALERAPAWAAGWFRLSQYEEKSGCPEAAIAALDTVLALDPTDLFGAGLKRAVISHGSAPNHPPSVFVERLFDDYADRFEHSLVVQLNYDLPDKLNQMLPSNPFAYVTDLGCGTGLMGERLRARTAWLEGFDLSANMLAKAGTKGIYDHLCKADLSLTVEGSGVFDTLPHHRADLIVAADVMIYIGDLTSIFEIAAALAAPGALFAFSVEDAPVGKNGEEGFHLAQSLRYAHTAAYIKSQCDRHGFEILTILRTEIRMDAGLPVPGSLVLTRSTGVPHEG